MLVIRRNNKICIGSNCSGTKNLTRDYYFKELYCSTLEQAELDISKQYNKEATSFQFDFLNDSLDKLPKGLLEAFKQNKPIIFFMNPPYGSANNMGTSGTSKSGIAKTFVNQQMLNDKIGASAQNLYAQFIYRIMMIKREYNLTNCHIAMFTPTLYLSGGSWKGFRKEFFKDFAYTDGCTFKASHFADVADNWGIAFSVWLNGKTFVTDYFKHELIDTNGEGVVRIGEKIVYNTDNTISVNDWAKESVKKLKTFDAPQISSGVIIKQNGRGRISKDALGYIASNSNNVDMNAMFVAMFSGAHSRSHGYVVNKDNFTRCTSLFAARKLVEKTWVNSKDEYMKPNTDHEKWQEFENDSIVYSLFNTSSNQSSLRQVEYKGKKWDIKNEFFWMSREEMMLLANENGNDVCYQDANVSTDRYVYNLLQNITLSKEAQLVLDKACELVRKTFKYRMMFDEDNENYQINNWDASYYQMKPLWKEYTKDDFEEFKSLYKKLGDKMRPMVYELGFLRK